MVKSERIPIAVVGLDVDFLEVQLQRPFHAHKEQEGGAKVLKMKPPTVSFRHT